MTGPSIKGKRICVVDDEPAYCELIGVMLGGVGARAREVASGAELFERLRQETFDCILLDYRLQTENGLGVLEALQSQFEGHPPVVMLTGTENQRTIIKAFRGGVSDYLLKRDLQPDELVSAVHRAIAHHEQERATLAELKRLKEHAGFDDATGLYSMPAMEERMTAIAAAPQRAFGIILIAFNEYQMIAERLGSVEGDKALRAFAHRLRGAARPVDVCGRRPPATFICFIDADFAPQTIGAIANGLQKALCFPMTLPEMSLDVSATVGVAVRENGESARDVLAAAERALAGALKQDGENHAGAAQGGDAASGGTDPVSRTTDRRRERRQRVLKSARIVCHDPPLSITCAVRDQSSLGVRLRLDSDFIVPQQFDLVFGTSSQRRRARKVWQTGREVGVAFL